LSEHSLFETNDNSKYRLFPEKFAEIGKVMSKGKLLILLNPNDSLSFKRHFPKMLYEVGFENIEYKDIPHIKYREEAYDLMIIATK
jgi:hypothetical protein